jgi:NAD(P)-dependent dehydrogenase (short-subunit alcohol dehydrogenase family)
MKTPQHWFITGVSGGLGRALAIEVLSKGGTVTGILRKEEQIPAFEALKPGSAFGLLGDVRDKSSMEKAVSETVEKLGRIDVLVNNAGYGLIGAVEELSESEIRDQMEVNFFGALFLTQFVLPTMRQQSSGHIFNISSIAGLNGAASLALYNASKFALEGFSEGLMLETRNLGIKVTIVEPGPFRTDWAGGGLVHSAQRRVAYLPITDLTRERLARVNGNQPGDPVRAAQLMIEVSEMENPPLRLLLGKPGYQVVEAKIERLSSEFAAWKEKGLATDFPENQEK